MSLFDEVGGIEMFRKINRSFYDKVYAHPWIGQYFKHIPQEHIENQQTDFMAGAFGGPNVFGGRPVPDAHMHLMITEELWALREKLLDEAFVELNAPRALVDRWKKIDLAFKRVVVKKSVADCEKRFKTDTILDFPNPDADQSNSFKKAS